MPRLPAAPVTFPTASDALAAAEGQRALAALLATGQQAQQLVIVDDNGTTHAIALPAPALRALADALAQLAQGNAVKVVPLHAELTTQEAADLLNVSRPHLVKLLESGELEFHRTGKHRRVRFDRLMAFKAQRDAASEAAMRELAAEAQALRLGYE